MFLFLFCFYKVSSLSPQLAQFQIVCISDWNRTLQKSSIYCMCFRSVLYATCLKTTNYLRISWDDSRTIDNVILSMGKGSPLLLQMAALLSSSLPCILLCTFHKIVYQLKLLSSQQKTWLYFGLPICELMEKWCDNTLNQRPITIPVIL